MAEWRSGSTGAGLFIGCGAGVGIVQPVSLHAIPLLGQLASSLSMALAQIDATTGGLGSHASRAASSLGARLGVPQLRAGAGCGVMVGYGWGFGLFAQRSALQKAQAALTVAAARLAEALPQPARDFLQKQQATQQRRQQPSAAAWIEQQQPQLASAGALPPARDVLLPAVPVSAPSSSLSEASHAAAVLQPGAAWQEQQQQRQQQQELAALSKLVLAQQNQLNELQQQVALTKPLLCSSARRGDNKDPDVCNRCASL